MAPERHPDLADAPAIVELAETRQVKRDVEPLRGGETAKLAACIVGIGPAEREREQAIAK